MSRSRTLFLEQCLTMKGMYKALEALELMKEEMCAESGYTRHDGSHYYYHLVDVTQDLLNHGVAYENCIIASLLHDYMEDVPGVTFKTIQQKFNTEVAEIVNLVTKTKDYDTLIYLYNIGLNVWAALIKAADRKHNFSTLKDASLEKRMKQAIETETYYIPFFKLMRKTYPRYAAFFYGAKTSIMPLLFAIKEYHAKIESLNEEIIFLKTKNNH